MFYIDVLHIMFYIQCFRLLVQVPGAISRRLSIYPGSRSSPGDRSVIACLRGQDHHP